MDTAHAPAPRPRRPPPERPAFLQYGPRTRDLVIHIGAHGVLGLLTAVAAIAGVVDPETIDAPRWKAALLAIPAGLSLSGVWHTLRTRSRPVLRATEEGIEIHFGRGLRGWRLRRRGRELMIAWRAIRDVYALPFGSIVIDSSGGSFEVDHLGASSKEVADRLKREVRARR